MSGNWNQMVCLASGRSDMGADFGWNPFKAIRKAAKTVGGAIASAGSSIRKVPVVGKGLHAVYSVASSPVSLTANIAAGHRVDKAVLNHFKGQINAAKDVAPYVQTVVSMVPGIGTTAAGVIGAATTLARGRPITEAIVEGVKGALPGGPVAKAAFEIAAGTVQGKPINESALKALPIPEEQKKVLLMGVGTVKGLAQGKPVDPVMFEKALQFLPPDARKALMTGATMGEAKKLQEVIAGEAKKAAPKLLEIGKTAIKADVVARAGVSSLPKEIQKGFLVGKGMVNYRFSPTELNAVRGNLKPELKKGFDIAMAQHVGKIVKPLNNPQLDPKVKFSYYTTIGMRGAKPKNQAAIEKTLSSDPKLAHGAKGALQTIQKEKNLKYLSFWARVKYLLTGR